MNKPGSYNKYRSTHDPGYFSPRTNLYSKSACVDVRPAHGLVTSQNCSPLIGQEKIEPLPAEGLEVSYDGKLHFYGHLMYYITYIW